MGKNGTAWFQLWFFDSQTNRIMINLNMEYKLILLVTIAMTLVMESQAKMLYTFSMMRHGSCYPSNDLYDGNETKQFKGQLTPTGLRQHYNLGSYLKQDYLTQQQIASPTFDPNQVEFYCTSYKRTHNSALAFIYGFYPLGAGWTIPPEVTQDKLSPPYTPIFPMHLTEEVQNDQFALEKGFQPLPVRELDDILNNCPDYDHLISERKIIISSQVKSFEEEQNILLSRMKTLFNLTSSQQNLQTMSDLFDTVIADLNLGRKMPVGFTETDLKNLKYMAGYYNTLIFNGNFAKVLSTPSLRMLRAKLNASIKDSKHKLTFLFGHQSNIHPWLTLFNLTTSNCLTQKWKGETITQLNCVDPPAYAANLIVELHEEDSSHFVKVKYNGFYVNLCQSKKIQCNYDEFMARVSNTETNFEEQCKIKTLQISQM